MKKLFKALALCAGAVGAVCAAFAVCARMYEEKQKRLYITIDEDEDT